MTKKRRRIFSVFPVLVFLVLVLATGCEQFFTFNVFSGLQRDPASLPPDQQIAYAENALASGDTASMSAAFALISDMADQNTDDPELQLLAADLAIGASGVSDLVSGFDPATATAADLNEALATVDMTVLAQVSTYVGNAETAGGDISDSQYVNAAASIVVNEANEAGGFESIDWTTPNNDIQDAIDYATSGGVDIEGMFSGL